jgi:hypothetical protein
VLKREAEEVGSIQCEKLAFTSMNIDYFVIKIFSCSLYEYENCKAYKFPS